MSIFQRARLAALMLSDTEGAIYTPTNQYKALVHCIMLCNTHTEEVTYTLSLSDGINTFVLMEVPLAAGADAKIEYETLEGMVLENGDTLLGSATVNNVVSCIVFGELENEYSIKEVFLQVTGSGFLDTQFHKLFDDAVNAYATYTLSAPNGSQYLTFKFAEQYVNSFSWWSYPGSERIKGFALQYSANGTDWIAIDTLLPVENCTGSGSLLESANVVEWIQCSFSAVKCVGLRFYAMSDWAAGDDNAGIAEVRINAIQ